MAARFQNFQGGLTTNNPLASGGTTLNSTALANLLTIAAPDTAWIVLDPDAVNGAPEIVQVTTHTAAATSATIVRAQQSTSARSHPVSTQWILASTTSDFDELPFRKVTAKGDLLVASAANVVGRRAVGSNDQVLLADSAQSDGVKWGTVPTAGITDLAVTEGKLGASAVATAKIADGAVTLAKISDESSSSYTPVLGNGWSVGDGVSVGRYIEIFGLVFFGARVTMGASSAYHISATASVTLPVPAHASSILGQQLTAGPGRGRINAVYSDANGGVFWGRASIVTATTAELLVGAVGGTYLSDLGITSSVPMGWAQNDILEISGWYEKA